jgi:hypothetical protein
MWCPGRDSNKLLRYLIINNFLQTTLSVTRFITPFEDPLSFLDARSICALRHYFRYGAIFLIDLVRILKSAVPAFSELSVTLRFFGGLFSTNSWQNYADLTFIKPDCAIW